MKDIPLKQILLKEMQQEINQKQEVINMQNLLIRNLKKSIFLNGLATVLFSVTAAMVVLTYGEPSIVEAIAVRIGGEW